MTESAAVWRPPEEAEALARIPKRALFETRKIAKGTMDVVSTALQAPAVSAHFVNSDGVLVALGAQGIPHEFRTRYFHEQHYRIDPLYTLYVGPRSGRFGRLGALRMSSRQSDEDYVAFLRQFGVVETADFVFRDEDRVIGGISLLWTSDAPPPPDLDEFGYRIHALVEYGFLQAWRNSEVGRRLELQGRYALTPREAEVLDYLCLGRTNADIARCMNVSVPTVKTHLVHMFEKLAVDNRSALVRRALLVGVQ